MTDERTYTINGVTYRLEPLSWRQTHWLGEHIFRGVDLQRLDYAVVHDLLREKGPLFMAICLIAEGQSRADHSRLPLQRIHDRAEEFAATLTGMEVALFGPHFFQSCQPGQMAMLAPGTLLQGMLFEAGAPSPVPGESGSSGASSPSVAATLPSADRSLRSGDRPSPIPTSGAASSATPWIAPSSATAASSCPG